MASARVSLAPRHDRREEPPSPGGGRGHRAHGPGFNGPPIRFHAEPDAIVVDRNGRRFFSEYAFHAGEALNERDSATGAFRHP